MSRCDRGEKEARNSSDMPGYLISKLRKHVLSCRHPCIKARLLLPVASSVPSGTKAPCLCAAKCKMSCCEVIRPSAADNGRLIVARRDLISAPRVIMPGVAHLPGKKVMENREALSGWH